MNPHINTHTHTHHSTSCCIKPEIALPLFMMLSLADCFTFFLLAAMNEKEMNHKVPPGFRFQPNEEELINHYLKRKVLGLDSEGVQPIADVAILKFGPWDLPELSAIKLDGPFWYFFTQLEHKYLNSKRFRRTTEAGYWKLTGKDHEVRSRTKELIGFKKILVFVSKKARNHSTKWVIHEYRATADFPNPNNYVICRLEKRGDGKANTSTHVEGESSGQSSSEIVNHVAENTVHEGEGASLVDFASQIDMEGVVCYDELLSQLSTEPNLNNEREAYPVETNSHENLVIESEGLDCDVVGMSSAQPPKSISEISHIENGGMRCDTNNEAEAIAQIDFPSQADIEEVNCYNELWSQLFAEQRPSYQDPPSSSGLISDYNGAQPQYCTTEPKEGFALLDSNLNNEHKAYSVEPNSHENMVIESEGLDCDVVGMSSTQPLKSVSEISHIENGGMSSDTNNEVAIAQVREATEHVTANEHEVEFEWESFLMFPDTSQRSHILDTPQLSHILDTPQLSYNSNEIDYSGL